MAGAVASVAALLLAFSEIGWNSDRLEWVLKTLGHSPPSEFPLGQLNGVAVSKEGKIICSSMFYSRIQIYEPNGTFAHGWPLDGYGGLFAILLDDIDRLHVYAVRGDTHYVFDLQGNLLDVFPGGRSKYLSLRDLNLLEARDGEGNVYRVRTPVWLPRVERITPAGEASIVVATPFRLWLLQGPQPTWTFRVIGVVLQIVALVMIASAAGWLKLR